MERVMKTVYEITMILLVILTIMTLWMDSAYNTTINIIVWLIFFLDFVLRFILAKNKWQFIKNNPFLLIAIIPLDQFFQMARIVRLLYFYRIKTIAKYYITPYVRQLTNKSLGFIVTIFIVILCSKAVFIWNVEQSIPTFAKGIAVVTGHLLFFGHRIFIIENPASITVLTITSITGVVLQGLALQWAFTKGEQLYQKLMRKDKKDEAI